MSTENTPDLRLSLLTAWLAEALGRAPERVAPASADASFRRYFRAWSGGKTFVAMDAPPDREDLAPYLRVATLLGTHGVHVPPVLARDEGQGFLLMSDLGSLQLLDALKGAPTRRGCTPTRSPSWCACSARRLRPRPTCRVTTARSCAGR